MSAPPSMPSLRPWQHVLNGFVIAWRFVAVLIAFALFGSVGILFLLVLWPLRNPPPHKAMQRQLLARRIVAASWRTLLCWLRLTGVISVRMEGFERLGRPGQLVLANHPSLLDVLFLVGYVPGINCVVKASLLGNPTMRTPILACGYVLNDVSERILADSDAALRQGQTLLVFPEGTPAGRCGGSASPVLRAGSLGSRPLRGPLCRVPAGAWRGGAGLGHHAGQDSLHAAATPDPHRGAQVPAVRAARRCSGTDVGLAA